MKKPFEYALFCKITHNILYETNIAPIKRDLQTWVQIGCSNRFELKQTRECYMDTRYKAKLRLYNYITYTKQGLEIPSYKPFLGTDIGVNTPILNF